MSMSKSKKTVLCKWKYLTVHLYGHQTQITSRSDRWAWSAGNKIFYFFAGLSGDRFHFDENGDAPARYKIKHFKQVSDGKYAWITVGEYIEGELKLNMSGKNNLCPI